MASIRDLLLTTLVARIDAIDGMTCELRAAENDAPGPVTCIVIPIEEDKELAGNRDYQCTFRVEVMVIVQKQDADAVIDGGNAYRYLDRQVTEVEKVLHTPDAWGVDPDYTDVAWSGHAVVDPDGTTEMFANMFLAFTYRHNYQDPTQ